eukprot:6983016-Alexandrium_andersonii.AAC.1
MEKKKQKKEEEEEEEEEETGRVDAWQFLPASSTRSDGATPKASSSSEPAKSISEREPWTISEQTM